MIEFFLMLTIGLALTFLANLALKDKALYKLLHAILWSLNGVIIVGGILIALSATDEVQNPILVAIVFFITGLIASTLLASSVRVLLLGLFPQPVSISAHTQDPDPLPDFAPIISDGEVLRPAILIAQPNTQLQPPRQGYDPHNPVHTLALIFCVYFLGISLASFILAGGLSGLAEDVSVNALTLLSNFALMLVIPLVGVGAFTRRSWPEIAERLGLQHLTWESLIVGAVSAVALIFIQGFMVGIWVLLVSEETFQRQNEASQAISNSINTIWLALGVALTAAIGEEIAFRGALQPIFGLWWTAVIFTLIHLQYTFTPAALIIFIVALGFGWLRQRYNLYAAIVAHFVYNFLPLLFVVAVS